VEFALVSVVGGTLGYMYSCILSQLETNKEHIITQLWIQRAAEVD